MPECINCFSTNIYRAGRCQTCYRHFRRVGVDRIIAPERQMAILQREQQRSLVRHLARSASRLGPAKLGT